MLHNFDGPYYTKNEKIREKHYCNHVFHVAGSIESMQHGYSLDEESNLGSKKYFHSKFE